MKKTKKGGFTPKQREYWKRLERVSASGRWNMHSREARIVSGLSEEQYRFVLENYEELEKSVKRVATKKGQTK